MNVEAAPAAVGVAAPMIVPSEPVSIVVDEKLMVVLNKDGGVESMEVNGGMALQVLSDPTSPCICHCHRHRQANCVCVLCACVSVCVCVCASVGNLCSACKLTVAVVHIESQVSNVITGFRVMASEFRSAFLNCL